jgi:hypothetical protein
MEESSRNNLNGVGQSPLAPKARPFQLKPRFFALGLAALTVFLPFLVIRRLETLVLHFFWPLQWLAEHLIPQTFQPSGGWWILCGITIGFFYAYFVWWLILVGFFKSSRHLKFALAACVILGVGLFYLLKSYKNQEDWTARGLNPDRPGYKPAVVLLAGTVDYRFKGSDTGQFYTGTARFEIRMRGYDLYYEKLWTGNKWIYNSFAFMQLALTNFYGSYNWSYSGSGHHGRGGCNGVGYEGLLPARRLWNGDEFVGASGQLESSHEQQIEIFKKLKQYGPYKIPGEIEFNEGDRHELFLVRKVEFLPQPTPEWFALVRKKHFENDEKIRKMDLGEPVW